MPHTINCNSSSADNSNEFCEQPDEKHADIMAPVMDLTKPYYKWTDASRKSLIKFIR